MGSLIEITDSAARHDDPMSRRRWIGSCIAAAVAGSACSHAAAPRPQSRKAQIAITLDLEMSRNFPKWEDTFWDYEKGNLNDDTKSYSVEAARRVKDAGGFVALLCRRAHV